MIGCDRDSRFHNDLGDNTLYGERVLAGIRGLLHYYPMKVHLLTLYIITRISIILLESTGFLPIDRNNNEGRAEVTTYRYRFSSFPPPFLSFCPKIRPFFERSPLRYPNLDSILERNCNYSNFKKGWFFLFFRFVAITVTLLTTLVMPHRSMSSSRRGNRNVATPLLSRGLQASSARYA